MNKFIYLGKVLSFNNKLKRRRTIASTG